MILYTAIALLTIALAFLVQNSVGVCGNRQFHNLSVVTRRQGVNILSLLAIFTVLFLPAALRLQVGNDYESYVDTIHEIYVGGYVVTEPLFNLIVKILCELSGGENYLLVFAVFSFVTIWLFLKVLYEQTEDFFLAFFLFMTLGVYFRTYNTMRYYLVLAITLYSFRFVLRKEYVRFLLLICMAAFLHKSVLVVIPLYLMAALTWKKWFVVLMLVGAGTLFIFQDIVLQLALYLYPSYRETVFLTQTSLSEHVLTIARCIAVCIFAAFFYQEAIKDKEENLFYLKLNVLAILMYTCGSFLPLVGRIGYYLITSQLLFLPSVLSYTENEKKRKLWLGLILIAGSLYFLLFLRSADEPGVRVLPYRSWLFYEKEFLNAETIF